MLAHGLLLARETFNGTAQYNNNKVLNDRILNDAELIPYLEVSYDGEEDGMTWYDMTWYDMIPNSLFNIFL